MDLPTKIAITRAATDEELAIIQQMFWRGGEGTEGMSEVLLPAIRKAHDALVELERVYLQHREWHDLLEQESLDANIAKLERLARIRVQHVQYQVDTLTGRGKVGQS
jgi:hypothetical protein